MILCRLLLSYCGRIMLNRLPTSLRDVPLALILIAPTLTLVQMQPLVAVTLQVRDLNGRAFARPIQIRDDEGNPLQTCQPDVNGRCTVQLTRGLYQIEPMGTQLDPLSAAAAVEIGGRWLAITVGDEPLAYGFVIDEGAVYFDNTPNAARPQPIRPTQADLAAHFSEGDSATEASSLAAETPQATAHPPVSPSTTVSAQSADTTTHNRLLLFVLTLTMGTVAIWWLTARKTQ